MEFYFTRVHSSDFIQVQAVLDFSPSSAIYLLLTWSYFSCFIPFCLSLLTVKWG